MELGPLSPLEAMDRSMVGAFPRSRSTESPPLSRALLAAALSCAAIALVAALVQLLGSAGGVLHSRSPVRAIAANGAAGLSLAARGQISGDMAATRPAFRASAAGDGFRTDSRAAGVRATYDRSGVRLAGAGVVLQLSLQGVGYGAAVAPVGQADPTAHANSVSYDRGQLREWYRNGPLGVEQGFTIERPPAGATSAPLTLTMSLGGNARATLAPDAQSVTLRHDGGVLTYGALVATDARGRTLHSWLGLAGDRLMVKLDAAGARFPLTIDPLVQKGVKLTSGESEGEARLGTSAALSADGSTLVIGGPHDEGSQGAVWVFARSGSHWTQQGPKLTAGEAMGEPALDECAEEAAEEAGECAFGASVALSADGNTALVGDPSATSVPGAAWVFTRSGTTWTRGPALTGPNEVGEGRFGKSVALSSDGTTALIGDPSASFQHGAAWVFVLAGGTWTRQAELVDVENRFAHFGRSVALSGDGDTALIGGPADSNYAGAAWAFSRSGATWSQHVRKLTGQNELGAGHFGKSVTLSADGETALVGAQDDNEERGAVWSFTRSGAVAFAQPGTKIEPAPELGEGHFGSGLALSGDGSLALIGVPRAAAGLGSVAVLNRSGSAWTERPALGGTEALGRGWSGASVALSSDGEVAAIGAPRDQKRAGAAWVFSNEAGFPPPTVSNVAPGRGEAGTRVTISGSNFTNEEGKLAVLFGSTSAASVELRTPAEIVATVPAGPEGLVDVRVQTASGLSSVSSGDTFRYESSGKATKKTQSPTGSSQQAVATALVGGVLGSSQSASAACRVSLRSKHLVVALHTSASIRLTRTGTGQCRGTVTLRYRQKTSGKRFKLRAIGSAHFSIAPGKSQVVKIRLNKLGKALFLAGHGKLNASVALLRTTPTPRLARTASVNLSVKKTRKPATVAR
jgi:IPT/TIG domain